MIIASCTKTDISQLIYRTHDTPKNSIFPGLLNNRRYQNTCQRPVKGKGIEVETREISL